MTTPAKTKKTLSSIDRALAKAQDKIITAGGGLRREWYSDRTLMPIFDSIQRIRSKIWSLGAGAEGELYEAEYKRLYERTRAR